MRLGGNGIRGWGGGLVGVGSGLRGVVGGLAPPAPVLAAAVGVPLAAGWVRRGRGGRRVNVGGGRGRRRGRRSAAHGAEPLLLRGLRGLLGRRLGRLAVVLLHLRRPTRGRGRAPRALRHRHHHLPLRHHHRHGAPAVGRPLLLLLPGVLHHGHVHHLVRARGGSRVGMASLSVRAVGREPRALRWIHDASPDAPRSAGAITTTF